MLRFGEELFSLDGEFCKAGERFVGEFCVGAVFVLDGAACELLELGAVFNERELVPLLLDEEFGEFTTALLRVFDTFVEREDVPRAELLTEFAPEDILLVSFDEPETARDEVEFVGT